MGTCPFCPLWGHAEVCSGAHQLDVSCLGFCCWPSLAPQSRCRLPSVKFQTLDLSLPCDTPQKSRVGVGEGLGATKGLQRQEISSC